MGAANAKILCETDSVFISQYNFSDHGLCFPTIYHISKGDEITLKAAADARGLRFGFWKEGWSKQLVFVAENGSKWRILDDTVEEWNNKLRIWIKQKPCKERNISKKSQLKGNCFLFCDQLLKIVVKFGEKFQEVDLDEIDKQVKSIEHFNEICRYNDKKFWEMSKAHTEYQYIVWQSNLNHQINGSYY